MKKHTAYIISIIIVILFFAAIYSSITNSDKVRETTEEYEKSQETIEEPLEIIHVKHQYKDGTHIFAGTLIVDNDCSDRLESSIDPEGPTLVFKTIDDNPGGPCTKEAFKAYPYKLFYGGGVDLEFKATVNDVPKRLNVYEISPNEDIDEVDLFIKA